MPFDASTSGSGQANQERGRIPPGQVVTVKFPVLHIGGVPAFDPQTWDFRVYGEVDSPLRFTYDQLSQLPSVARSSDFHCVTGWSRLDNAWEGVSFIELMRLAQPRSSAHFVIAHCDGAYTTNVPFEMMMDEDVLLAHRLGGANLSPEHGGPLRTVVPALYAYKCAKWVRALELSAVDKPGFWEVRGYHNRADPWKEERFSL
jgi:DMSO/TMAO reductase YedYZ molybdopterin-dependent catalytic subunit